METSNTQACETVIDFGQNMTGYVEFRIKGTPGAQATISHGETLDRDGNFYNANYRSADAQIKSRRDCAAHTSKSARPYEISTRDWSSDVCSSDLHI